MTCSSMPWPALPEKDQERLRQESKAPRVQGREHGTKAPQAWPSSWHPKGPPKPELDSFGQISR
ncbi:hypothetical protein CR513_27581, partial [Mucuna pruriens]